MEPSAPLDGVGTTDDELPEVTEGVTVGTLGEIIVIALDPVRLELAGGIIPLDDV